MPTGMIILLAFLLLTLILSAVKVQQSAIALTLISGKFSGGLGFGGVTMDCADVSLKTLKDVMSEGHLQKTLNN